MVNTKKLIAINRLNEKERQARKGLTLLAEQLSKLQESLDTAIIKPETDTTSSKNNIPPFTLIVALQNSVKQILIVRDYFFGSSISRNFKRAWPEKIQFLRKMVADLNTIAIYFKLNSLVEKTCIELEKKLVKLEKQFFNKNILKKPLKKTLPQLLESRLTPNRAPQEFGQQRIIIAETLLVKKSNHNKDFTMADLGDKKLKDILIVDQDFSYPENIKQMTKNRKLILKILELHDLEKITLSDPQIEKLYSLLVLDLEKIVCLHEGPYLNGFSDDDTAAIKYSLRYLVRKEFFNRIALDQVLPEHEEEYFLPLEIKVMTRCRDVMLEILQMNEFKLIPLEENLIEELHFLLICDLNKIFQEKKNNYVSKISGKDILLLQRAVEFLRLKKYKHEYFEELTKFGNYYDLPNHLPYKQKLFAILKSYNPRESIISTDSSLVKGFSHALDAGELAILELSRRLLYPDEEKDEFIRIIDKLNRYKNNASEKFSSLIQVCKRPEILHSDAISKKKTKFLNVDIAIKQIKFYIGNPPRQDKAQTYGGSENLSWEHAIKENLNELSKIYSEYKNIFQSRASETPSEIYTPEGVFLLNPEVAKQIECRIDSNTGNIKKEKDALHTHAVIQVADKIFLKFTHLPKEAYKLMRQGERLGSFPGIESAVNILNKLCVSVGSPPTILLKIQVRGHYYAVVVSESIPGFGLDIMLRQKPNFQIDPENFSTSVTMALLTRPADGKGDNYIATKRKDKVLVVGIDNDISWAPSIYGYSDKVGAESNHYPGLYSILFYMPQMSKKIPEKVKALFLKLKPELLVIKWLKELNDYNTQFQQPENNIFTKNELTALNLPAKLAPGSAILLYNTLKKIQSCFQDFPEITNWELFSLIEPETAFFYEKVYQKYNGDPFECSKGTNYMYMLKEGNTFERLCKEKYMSDTCFRKKIQSGRSGDACLVKINKTQSLEDALINLLDQIDFSDIPKEIQISFFKGLANVCRSYLLVRNSSEFVDGYLNSISNSVKSSRGTLQKVILINCDKITLSAIRTLLSKHKGIKIYIIGKTAFEINSLKKLQRTWYFQSENHMKDLESLLNSLQKEQQKLKSFHRMQRKNSNFIERKGFDLSQELKNSFIKTYQRLRLTYNSLVATSLIYKNKYKDKKGWPDLARALVKHAANYLNLNANENTAVKKNYCNPLFLLAIEFAGKNKEQIIIEIIRISAKNADLLTPQMLKSFHSEKRTKLDLHSSNFTDSQLKILLLASPRLNDINIDNCHSITDKGFSVIAKCKKLEHLSFKFCSKITSNAYSALLSLTSLISIYFNGSKITQIALNEETFINIVGNNEELRVIDASYCTGLTDKSLDVLKNMQFLQKFTALSCQAFSTKKVSAFVKGQEWDLNSLRLHQNYKIKALLDSKRKKGSFSGGLLTKLGFTSTSKGDEY